MTNKVVYTYKKFNPSDNFWQFTHR